MAGPIFPACGYIINPVLTEIDSTSLDVAWSGVATTFKLRYRKTGTSAWTEVTMAGTGSSGGSTYFTANPANPAQVNPVSYDDTITALFHLTPLEAGAKYDLELVNVCLDGSEYTLPLFFAFTSACVPITNFKVMEQKNDVTALATWDPVVGVSDFILVAEEEGENEEDEYPVSGTQFLFTDFKEGKKYRIWLTYECETGGTIQSDPVYLLMCGCAGCGDDDECRVVGEIPAGDVDGVNATFTTAFDFIPGTVEVFVNGLRQDIVTHYNTSGTRTILFVASPAITDHIEVNYSR